ncbi:MAG: hypothetical protein ACRC7O_18470, partial [Fimbriiglobus sp.]
GPTSASTGRAWRNKPLPADGVVSADVFLNNPADTVVFARGAGLDGATPTYYAANVSRGMSASLSRVAAGVETALGTAVKSTAYTSQVWVRLTLEAKGTTVRMQVSQPEKGLFLTPQGTWAAAETWAVTATDAAIPAGGFAGVSRKPGNANPVGFDNFTVAAGKVIHPPAPNPPVVVNPTPPTPPTLPTPTPRTPTPTPVETAALPPVPAQPAGPVVELNQTAITAPIVLNQANTTYRLKSDITAPGTAFVVSAPGVTLDLNGKTVTYGTAASPVVPNGGFEQPAADPAKPANWDVSAAPTAKRVAARTGMFGGWMFDLTKFDVPQTITSDWVPIPEPGREYAAVVFPRGTSDVTVEIRILAENGTVLRSDKQDSVNTGRGYAPVSQFVPPAGTTRVRVQIVAIPPAKSVFPNQPKTEQQKAVEEAEKKKTQQRIVSLDGVGVYRSRDYGVMATTSRNGSVANDLPPQVPANLAAVPGYWNAARLAVRNGAIVQGAGRAFAGNPLFVQSLPGLTLTGVTTVATGVDTDNLSGKYLSNLDIRNCTFDADVPAITRRMNGFAAVRLENSNGNFVFAGNTITNAPMCGLYVNNHISNPAKVRIVGNTIRQRATVSDGYGILVCGLDNFEIGNNQIRPVTGRGILFDGFSSRVTQNGDVHDNVVEAYERPNLEYGPNGLEATALRMRNYKGNHRNIGFRNNVFVARTDAAGVNQAIACRVTFDDRQGQMHTAALKKEKLENNNLRFENNTFRATVEVPDGDRRATAVSLAAVSPRVGLRFFGNTFESNSCTLAVGDNDTQFPNEDVAFVANTHRRAGSPVRPDFATTVVGGLNFPAKDIRLIDARFEGGADPAVTFVGTGEKLVGVGPVARVLVSAGGVPVGGATVTVYDRYNTAVWAVTTDGTGRVAFPAINVVHAQPDKTQPSARTSDVRGPFRVVVGYGGKTQTRTDPLIGNTVLNFGF